MYKEIKPVKELGGESATKTYSNGLVRIEVYTIDGDISRLFVSLENTNIIIKDIKNLREANAFLLEILK